MLLAHSRPQNATGAQLGMASWELLLSPGLGPLLTLPTPGRRSQARPMAVKAADEQQMVSFWPSPQCQKLSSSATARIVAVVASARIHAVLRSHSPTWK